MPAHIPLRGEGQEDDGMLRTRRKLNQSTSLNLILKGVLVSFLTRPRTSKLTEKRVRTNLISEPLLPEPGSASSLGSSEARIEPIVKMKPNPKGDDFKLPNALLNAENAQKMSENAPYQFWAFWTLILQYLPSPTSKR